MVNVGDIVELVNAYDSLRGKHVRGIVSHKVLNDFGLLLEIKIPPKFFKVSVKNRHKNNIIVVKEKEVRGIF